MTKAELVSDKHGMLTVADEQIGLYNNMALALKDTEQWESAKSMFSMARSVNDCISDGEIRNLHTLAAI